LIDALDCPRGAGIRAELAALDAEVRIELLAQARLIEQFGPAAKRPRVDTLNGSKHANMKELRFDAAGGVWRAAFAFDPKRAAILLVAGDKSGQSERTFYKRRLSRLQEQPLSPANERRCAAPLSSSTRRTSASMRTLGESLPKSRAANGKTSERWQRVCMT